MHAVDFITVSRHPGNVQMLTQSICLAMGGMIPYKVTVIDGNQHDLFTGYNTGAAQTQAEVMVFVHDDVHLLGNALTFSRPLRLLAEPSTGFIGIVGARFLETNGGWWGKHLDQKFIFENCRGMVINPRENEFGMHAMIWPGGTAEFGRVMVADGVLLMCHLRTFHRLGGFDSINFRGFHFYDVDITFRAHQLGLKNYAAPLLVLHHSLGNYDQAWDNNRQIFAEKHKVHLPCSL